MDGFTVITQQYPDRAVITVSGEMDLGSCPELARAALVLPVDGKELHLDLSGVAFMDSSGLNLLLQLRLHVRARGGQLLVMGLRDQPAQLLRLTETHDLLTAPAMGVALSRE
ncbi:STAS domain-containing protein [Streptomyces sp. NPDC001595]|uniref:STAS domain-containing protein n=1 Tax=Streptomyces sp. NPDC001532 TaxID=3154520 RepID=UPI00331DE2D2